MGMVASSGSRLDVDRHNNDRIVDAREVTDLRLDDLDHKILAHLVENGRTSFAALGQQIGLSTAATKRRVDRLLSDGAIRRFTAELEPSILGWSLEAFVELYCEGRVPPDRMRRWCGRSRRWWRPTRLPANRTAFCGSGRPILRTSKRFSA